MIANYQHKKFCMKNFLIIECLLAGLLLAGCYKDNPSLDDHKASFTILHAWPGNSSDLLVVAGSNRTSFKMKSTVHYYKFNGVDFTGIWTYGVSSREASLVQVYTKSDSTKPVFTKLIEPVTDRRNNILVSGTPAGPEFLYLDDHPATPTDSSAAIRFVNLCPGFAHISVNIAGNATGSEVSDLPYMQASTFKVYKAKIAQHQIVFEFRDKSTGDIVYTFPYVAIPFTNVNICLRGIAGQWPDLQAIPLFQ
jgi:hypothetical protein